MTSRSLSVSLPHFSFTLPFICFQFPLTWSQFMIASLLESKIVLPLVVTELARLLRAVLPGRCSRQQFPQPFIRQGQETGPVISGQPARFFRRRGRALLPVEEIDKGHKTGGHFHALHGVSSRANCSRE